MLKRLNKTFQDSNKELEGDKLNDHNESSSVSSSFSNTDSSGWSMSSFDSEASRVNYWKDINTKDDDYKDAVFMD